MSWRISFEGVETKHRLLGIRMHRSGYRIRFSAHVGVSRNDHDLARTFVTAVRHRGRVNGAAAGDRKRIALLVRLKDAVRIAGARGSGNSGLENRCLADDLLKNVPHFA